MDKHKQQILNCIQKEINICKRLYTLLPANTLDYKPAPELDMRTTLELLQYLTWCASSCVENYMETDLEVQKKIYSKNSDYGDTMKPEDFPKRMDEQMEKINTLLKDITDDDLLTKEVMLPWREPMILGLALMETSLKWLTGYKVQLFLYAKLSGAKELDTGDLWING